MARAALAWHGHIRAGQDAAESFAKKRGWGKPVTKGTGLTPLQAIGRFGGHIFSGVVIFLFIAVPAGVLHILIHAVAWDAGFRPFLYGLAGLEYIIFIVDGLLFVAYLVV